MSGSGGSEGQIADNGMIFNMRQKSTFDEGNNNEVEATLKMRRWIQRRPNEDVRRSPSPENQDSTPDCSSPVLQETWQPNPGKVLIHPEEAIHRKLDRKAIARRHLVCGLNSGNHVTDKKATTVGGLRIKEDVRRACSFNCHTSGELSQLVAPNGKQTTSSTNSLSKNRAVVRRTVGTDRAREAIDSFNSLVHELHAEQHRDYLRQGSAHLAVLSDAGADSSGGSHQEGYEDDEDRLTSGKLTSKLSRTSSLTFTDMKFPVGIGFTRYRPLTPNLLLRLDKLKMPVKRRTQQWVNNIQESKRTLSKSSLVDLQTSAELQLRKDKSCAIQTDIEKET